MLGQLRSSDLDTLAIVIEAMPGGVTWKDSDLIYRGSNSAAARGMGVATPEEVALSRKTRRAWICIEVPGSVEVGEPAHQAHIESAQLPEHGVPVAKPKFPC